MKKDGHYYSQLEILAGEVISDTGKWKGILRKKETVLWEGEQEPQLEQAEQPYLEISDLSQLNSTKRGMCFVTHASESTD